MVSIPAARKRPDIPEYAYQLDQTAADNFGAPVVDTSFQPYAEVLPGDPRAPQAAADAQKRLAIFHTGVNPDVETVTTYSRYTDPGQTGDILDPAVVGNPVCHPVPVANQALYDNPLPEHPHWVNTDLTSIPGVWSPRQTNWPSVLVEQNLPALDGGTQGGCSASSSGLSALEDEVKAIKMLPDAHLSDIQPYATTPQAFGLWQSQTGCDLSKQPTVQSFGAPGASGRPHWMDLTNPPATAPVYTQTPGQAVFKMICINCHGPTGSADGRLATNLATMTGGNALVANFHEGLFGPPGVPDGMRYRAQIFGALPSDATSQWTGATVDDRAARYMAWMGLGGTSVIIPVEVLQVVAVTKVLDQQRVLASASLSANMLSQAKSLCQSLLWPAGEAEFYFGDGHGYLDANVNLARGLNPSIIWKNGDAEMWLNLCALANPPPVRVFTLRKDALSAHLIGAVNPEGQFAYEPGTLIPQSVYPAGVPVGNERGGTEASLTSANLWPWCVDDSSAPSDQQAALAAHVPICPKAVLDASATCTAGDPLCLSTDDASRWAVRGAINAGMSVFLYLKSIEDSGPPPDFNQCNLLK
jgi:mono/diheme cytochrome c family protein